MRLARISDFTRAARKFCNRPFESKVVPFVSDDQAKTTKRKQKQDHGPYAATAALSVLPGAASRTNDDSQIKSDVDILARTLRSRGNGGHADLEGAVDTGTSADTVVNTAASTLPVDHPLMVRLSAILDEKPPAKSNKLAPSESHVKKAREVARRHKRAFDGHWKLDDDSIELPEEFAQLVIRKGKVTDRAGHSDKLKIETTRMSKETLWNGLPVRLSEDKDQLTIIDMRGYPVKYVRV